MWAHVSYCRFGPNWSILGIESFLRSCFLFCARMMLMFVRPVTGGVGAAERLPGEQYLDQQRVWVQHGSGRAGGSWDAGRVGPRTYLPAAEPVCAGHSHCHWDDAMCRQLAAELLGGTVPHSSQVLWRGATWLPHDQWENRWAVSDAYRLKVPWVRLDVMNSLALQLSKKL